MTLAPAVESLVSNQPEKLSLLRGDYVQITHLGILTVGEVVVVPEDADGKQSHGVPHARTYHVRPETQPTRIFMEHEVDAYNCELMLPRIPVQPHS